MNIHLDVYCLLLIRHGFSSIMLHFSIIVFALCLPWGAAPVDANDLIRDRRRDPGFSSFISKIKPTNASDIHSPTGKRLGLIDEILAFAARLV